jgi:hypothetical protein
MAFVIVSMLGAHRVFGVAKTMAQVNTLIAENSYKGQYVVFDTSKMTVHKNGRVSFKRVATFSTSV